MRELTEQEKEELAQHKLWLDTKGEKGKRLNWSCKDLRGANLKGANLEGADLEGADLTNTWINPNTKILGNIYIIESDDYPNEQQILQYRLATPMEIILYG